MSKPALTMSSEVETMAPLDLCFIIGPLGVLIPTPFPGKSLPMVWASFCSKVMLDSLPAINASTKGPMCKPHGGPAGGVKGGAPLGIGPHKCSVTLTVKVKFCGAQACNEGSLYMHNSDNSPILTKASKGCPKVKIS